MRHGQNNLAREMKQNHDAFQAHEKEIAIYVMGRWKQFYWGGMLKQPYTIWTNTT